MEASSYGTVCGRCLCGHRCVLTLFPLQSKSPTCTRPKVHSTHQIKLVCMQSILRQVDNTTPPQSWLKASQQEEKQKASDNAGEGDKTWKLGYGILEWGDDRRILNLLCAWRSKSHDSVKHANAWWLHHTHRHQSGWILSSHLWVDQQSIISKRAGNKKQDHEKENGYLFYWSKSRFHRLHHAG